MLRSRE